jgi:hypothetical protein
VIHNSVSAAAVAATTKSATADKVNEFNAVAVMHAFGCMIGPAHNFAVQFNGEQAMYARVRSKFGHTHLRRQHLHFAVH